MPINNQYLVALIEDFVFKKSWIALRILYERTCRGQSCSKEELQFILERLREFGRAYRDQIGYTHVTLLMKTIEAVNVGTATERFGFLDDPIFQNLSLMWLIRADLIKREILLPKPADWAHPLWSEANKGARFSISPSGSLQHLFGFYANIALALDAKNSEAIYLFAYALEQEANRYIRHDESYENPYRQALYDGIYNSSVAFYRLLIRKQDPGHVLAWERLSELIGKGWCQADPDDFVDVENQKFIVEHQFSPQVQAQRYHEEAARIKEFVDSSIQFKCFVPANEKITKPTEFLFISYSAEDFKVKGKKSGSLEIPEQEKKQLVPKEERSSRKRDSSASKGKKAESDFFIKIKKGVVKPPLDSESLSSACLESPAPKNVRG